MMKEVNKESLVETHSTLAKDWDTQKNTNLTPSDVFSESHKRVWWICQKGHEEFDSIRYRVLNDGCAQCKSERRRAEIKQKNSGIRFIEGSFSELVYNPDLKLKDILGSNADFSNTTLEEILDVGGPNKEMRIYNCLKRAGINTLDQVLECDYEKLFRVRNFGIRLQIRLYEILKQHVSESN